jgi:ABC-2 type transport system ATP-binding protein
MAEVMIEARDLTKYYGDFLAIEHVSFQVHKGEIVGFLGPNGSGKTTTMRILTGYMPPSSGSAQIAGHDVLSESLEARRQIGYLPETVPLYTDMVVEDYLAYMGRLRGMEQPRLGQRIDQVIELVRVEQYRNALVGKLSKGFRQRLGLAQAILHEPQVLIMDEPTIGIDPIQVVETRQLIRDLGREHTLLLSTHILAEVSVVCQRVLIIHEGNLVAEDTPDNLAQRLQATDRVEAEVRGPVAQVTSAFRAINGVTDVRSTGAGDAHTYTVESRDSVNVREEMARVVVNHGWGLLRLTPTSMSLEEVFLRLTSGEEKQ